MSNKTISKRAFELAREGSCRSVDEMRRRLNEERFDAVQGYLASAMIKRQLNEVMKTQA